MRYNLSESRWCCSKCWLCKLAVHLKFSYSQHILQKSRDMFDRPSAVDDPSIVFNMLTCIKGVTLVNNTLMEIRSVRLTELQ